MIGSGRAKSDNCGVCKSNMEAICDAMENVSYIYAWSGCEARHDCQALMLRGVVILQRTGGRGRGRGFMHAAIARRSGV